MGKKITREEIDARVEANRKRVAQEEQARRERTEKASARRAWLADGGSEADFEKSWPKLRDEARSRRVMDADQRARARQRESLRSSL
jgi:hypothetical protein